MARKNKARNSQPVRDRTPLASRRVHGPRSYSPDRSTVGPALAFQVRRAAEPNLRVTVKRKTATTSYVDVKTSLRPVADTPLSISRPKAAKPKPKYAPVRKPVVKPVQSPRPVSQLSLAPAPEPDVRKSSEKARDLPVCKKRPDSKKAARSRSGGGGKKFVPWC